MATAGGIAITEDPLLVYNWACPFVHRVSLALGMKKASLPKVEIDLKNKPSWLPQYSPHGKVPAVTYIEDGKQKVLYESLALVYWVDEYFTKGPALMPESPAQRALARIIIQRWDSTAVPLFYQALRAQTVEDFVEPLAKLRAEFTWLEQNTALAENPDSPFLMGPAPSLVDVVIGPVLLRTPIFKHFKNIDALGQHPSLKAYLERFRQLPEVQGTFLPPGGGGWEAWVQGVTEGSVMFAKEQVDFSAVDK